MSDVAIVAFAALAVLGTLAVFALKAAVELVTWLFEHPELQRKPSSVAEVRPPQPRGKRRFRIEFGEIIELH